MDGRSEWVGALFLAVIVALVGVPVAVTQAGGGDPTHGPGWLWWACYAAYIGAFLATFWERGVSWWRPSCGIVAMAVAGAALFLLAHQGWTAILLVFTAAIAAHVLSKGATLALVAVQTVLIPMPSLWTTPTWELLLGGAMYGGIQMLSVWAVWVQVRETAMREELAVANTELRAATALLAETSRGTERLRIARELHDVVGHQLTALALELEVAGHHATPATQEHVDRSRDLAKDLLRDVRTSVGGLRDRQPPLRAALEHVVAGLPHPLVHLEVDDGLGLDEEQVATVIRCVQEVVTNTIRHARADNLWIEVGRDEAGAAVLRARDDGVGSAAFRPGHGLTGMRERFEQVGGEVAFATGGGFRVDARLPAR